MSGFAADRRKIIVGLGNPGQRYRKTRHNLGFWSLDLLAQTLEAPWKATRHNAHLAEIHHSGWKLILAKPVTFMNLSGEAALPLVQYTGCTPQDLLVICDDVNLPVGKLRIRKSGSAGGHHGLESIIGALGTADFPRIRIGIKPLDAPLPDNLADDFVLAPFKKGEEAIVAETVKRSVEAILTIIEKDLDAAMNLFNH